MAKKPTYGELEQRVKELEKEAVERKRAEDKEKQYIRELEFLSKTATEFVDLSLDENIYQFIGKKLTQLIGESIVIVNSFSGESDRGCTRAILGLGKKTEAVIKILGADPVGKTFKVEDEGIRALTGGKLHKIPGGIYRLTPEIPKAAFRAIEKLLALGDAYSMGFSWEGKLFGNAIILLRQGCELENQNLIETFMRQASVALQRRGAEEALRKAHDELEMRVDERTAELVKTNERLKREIEERKLAEDGLRQSMSLLQHVADYLPVMFSYIDSDERYIYANRQFEDPFGPGTVVGKRIEEVLSPELYEEVRPRLDAVLAGDSVDYERIGLIGEDDKRCFLASYRPDKDESGNVNGFFALLWDVTEIKQKEEALRESEQRFKEMADLLPTVISELDRDFNLTYVNQAAFETFGYSQDEFEAGLNAMDMIHPADRKRALTNIEKVMRGKRLDGNEYRMVRKDGSELTALIHSRPIYKNGRAVGIRCTITDITKRKKAEQALREREAELEIKTNSLEEVNTALRVLLERRDEDKRELEDKVLANVKELVVPFLEKVKKSQLDPRQVAYMDILESNLNDIISPFLRNLSTKYVSLTPTEIRVAHLIKEGKSTKEIGEVMALSPRTIETHRKNMRKKFGIEKKRGNLRSHLSTLQ